MSQINDLSKKIIKIKISNSYYYHLMKKYNLFDSKLPFTKEQRINEYKIVIDILKRIKEYETNNEAINSDELIEYGLVKMMQYDKRLFSQTEYKITPFCNKTIYKLYEKIEKKVKKYIPLLRSGMISKERKIRKIKNLNNKIIDLIDIEEYYRAIRKNKKLYK